MATTTITRTSYTDDTGDGISGDIWGATLIGTSIYDPIDSVLSSDLELGGDLVVSGTGPHSFGGAAIGYFRNYFTGAFTSSGASTQAVKLAISGALTGHSGDSARLCDLFAGAGGITLAGTCADVSTMILFEPLITTGGNTATVASTLHIASAPTEGTTNWAAWVEGSKGSLFDQNSATGAVPVITLDQADVSEEMMEFACTIGTGNGIEAVAAKTLTTTHFVKVTIPGGLTRYFPVGTIA